MIKRNSYHHNRDIVPQRAGFKQINSEVESVVVLTVKKFFRKDQLVHLAYFGVQNCTVLIFVYRLFFAQVKENLSY